MPVTPTYPGVYIEEVPSGVHTITGVATSITAFIGRAWKGPMDKATTIYSYADYQRIFGGLWRPGTMSYAVKQFYDNGGSEAIIVRVATREADEDNAVAPPIIRASAATCDLGNGFMLNAANEGTWGVNLVLKIAYPFPDDDPNLFNISILDDPDTKKDNYGRGGSGAFEEFLNVSMDPDSPRFVKKILEQQSKLVRAELAVEGGQRPAANNPANPYDPNNPTDPPYDKYTFDENSGNDGAIINDNVVLGDNDTTGLYALKKADLFNILCIPPYTPGESGTDVHLNTWKAAAKFCKDHRAFLIVDAPHSWTVSTASSTTAGGYSDYSAIEREYSAIYFPRLKLTDRLQDGMLEFFAPCGVIAGLMSRIDSARGVWKAPAGLEATLKGVMGLGIDMTDGENGTLNKIGINCIRRFPGIGTVCWGARTLAGQDILASEWKYIPVRRLALFLEESLFRGTKWVVFEPNDEPLWAKIRMNVGAFMMRLFRQGAFQGDTPDKAFYVKCDAETTTQSDRDLGIVNIEVGFAPLKPAEFVIIKIQQIAGEL